MNKDEMTQIVGENLLHFRAERATRRGTYLSLLAAVHLLRQFGTRQQGQELLCAP